MKLNFYKTSTGNAPVEKALESLDRDTAPSVYAALKDIESLGLKKANVKFRAIKGKLWELKIGQHRIFYVCVAGPTLVLLHVCKKQSQKARKQDIGLALTRMKKVLKSP